MSALRLEPSNRNRRGHSSAKGAKLHSAVARPALDLLDRGKIEPH